MTAFITHCLRKTRLDGCALLMALGLVLLFAGPSQAQTVAPEVQQIRVERIDDAYLLSASLRFELPDAVEIALLKGVAMFFVAEVDVVQERWYWTAKKVASAQRHLRLAYQPLTRRWRLNVGSGAKAGLGLAMALNQNFDSLSEALLAMQRIYRWSIVDAALIDPALTYRLDFSFRLDNSQLPRPLQIGTFGQSDWSLAMAASRPWAVEDAP